MDKNISKAIDILNQGGIIIFPTDTAFGIGCRIDNQEAIERLFKIRKRPQEQAVPVLVSNLKMAKDYALEFPQKVIQKLIKRYWPGALTVVVKCQKNKVHELVRGGTETIGLRMPNNATILKVIEQVGVPILGPSANFHGENTPFDLKDLNPKLVKLVDFVLEGECELKSTSTVVDVSEAQWKILRQGALNITMNL
jgi:L-threonylcarbamoyladenylate synthase